MGACHSEEDHMDFILEQFSPNGACDATAGQVQKITGHVVPATAELFFAPVSGKPCVWYRTIIEEQVIHTAMTQRGVSHFNVWERLVTSEQVSDFFLKDGDSEVLVPGQSAAARFQSLCVGAKNGVWSGAPPPGVGLMVQTAIAKATGGQKSRNARWWDQSKSKNKTGKYRYTEQAFDVNELVTALGIVVKNNTGGEKEEGGGGLKMEAVTSETNVDMSTWTARAKYAWKELVKEPQILLSDHPEHYEGLTVMDPRDVSSHVEFFTVAKTEKDFGLMFERKTTQLELGRARDFTKPPERSGGDAAAASEKVSPETHVPGEKEPLTRLESVNEEDEA